MSQYLNGLIKMEVFYSLIFEMSKPLNFSTAVGFSENTTTIDLVLLQLSQHFGSLCFGSMLLHMMLSFVWLKAETAKLPGFHLSLPVFAWQQCGKKGLILKLS